MPEIGPGRIVTTFTVERETKNTLRFQEEVQPGEQPVIGTLYVQKTALDKATINGRVVLTIVQD